MEEERCEWCLGTDLMRQYHDTEWGVPLRDDRKLFEFMVLDAFQAGLSWSTILNKRENFRHAFDDFDPEKVAMYDDLQFQRLMNDAGIIRNRQKISASINNAQRFLEVKKEFGNFADYIWQFTDGKTIVNAWEQMSDIPPRSPESDAMSRDLQKRGFKFVGTTICYAFMQAAGMINDHKVSCFRYRKVSL